MMPSGVPWLAPALTGGFAVMTGLALLLWRDLRQSERISARLRMVRTGGVAGSSQLVTQDVYIHTHHTAASRSRLSAAPLSERS